MAMLEVKVPELSESVSEASLMQWKKKVGQAVEAEEILVEIETDKIILEVPSPVAGVISELVFADGAMVQSGQVIARIDTSAKSATVAKAEEVVEPFAEPPIQPAAIYQTKEPILMPAAAKLASENKLQPEQLTGTGRDGRITKGDVLNALSAKDPFSDAVLQAPLEDRTEVREPMSKLRATIAQRLLESQQNTASLTTFNEVNMAAVMDLRKKFQDQFTKRYGIKLGFMSFFVKAVVHALKQFPIVNASIDGNDIVYHNYFDMGMAIGSPRGLVVPVLRDADKLSFAEIELQIAEFANKAKDGKLSMAELSGGTFTITNGGTYGSMMSTPIINPPQSAILGIHATKDRPVVEDGQIVIRPMCYLALSYDHRLIDGKDAVLTLVVIKDALEAPERMLIDL